jgi:hypothetical protein
MQKQQKKFQHIINIQMMKWIQYSKDTAIGFYQDKNILYIQIYLYLKTNNTKSEHDKRTNIR